MVDLPSTIDERLSPLKSIETSGSSVQAQDALHRAAGRGAEGVVELLGVGDLRELGR